MSTTAASSDPTPSHRARSQPPPEKTPVGRPSPVHLVQEDPAGAGRRRSAATPPPAGSFAMPREDGGHLATLLGLAPILLSAAVVTTLVIYLLPASRQALGPSSLINIAAPFAGLVAAFVVGGAVCLLRRNHTVPYRVNPSL